MELDDLDDGAASSDPAKVEYTPISTFEELNISADLLSALKGAGFTAPNSSQAQILPRILQAPLQNAVVQSISASGKTLCFILAMLTQVSVGDKVPQALCVCPTRELALQIHDVLTRVTQNTQITTFCAVGVDFDKLEQIQYILRHLDQHVIIGTTGVLMRALSQQKLDISSLKVLVFDEVDDLWDKTGFPDETRHILTKVNNCNAGVQVLMFSATFSGFVRQQISSLITIDHEIVINKEAYRFPHLKQFKVACADLTDKATVIKDKILALGQKIEKVIIFVVCQSDGNRIYKSLSDAGYPVRCLQIYDKLRDRDVTLKEFREGKFKILIATDIIARGFDDPKVNLVINLNLPAKEDAGITVINLNLPAKHDFARTADCDLYLHRIGRAGRTGQKSCIFNLFDDYDAALMTSIEKKFCFDIREVRGKCMNIDGEIDDVVEYEAALQDADLL